MAASATATANTRVAIFANRLKRSLSARAAAFSSRLGAASLTSFFRFQHRRLHQAFVRRSQNRVTPALQVEHRRRDQLIRNNPGAFELAALWRDPQHLAH